MICVCVCVENKIKRGVEKSRKATEIKRETVGIRRTRICVCPYYADDQTLFSFLFFFWVKIYQYSNIVNTMLLPTKINVHSLELTLLQRRPFPCRNWVASWTVSVFFFSYLVKYYQKLQLFSMIAYLIHESLSAETHSAIYLSRKL